MFKRLLFTAMLLFSALHAEVINVPAGRDLLQKGIPVVDIRTPQEWKQTGLLKGSIPIMFFDERGGYNVDAFIKQLHKHVDTSKPFALICRTGSRTKMVSQFLAATYGYKVINLLGGITEAYRRGLPFEPYTKR